MHDETQAKEEWLTNPDKTELEIILGPDNFQRLNQTIRDVLSKESVKQPLIFDFEFLAQTFVHANIDAFLRELRANIRKCLRESTAEFARKDLWCKICFTNDRDKRILPRASELGAESEDTISSGAAETESIKPAEKSASPDRPIDTTPIAKGTPDNQNSENKSRGEDPGGLHQRYDALESENAELREKIIALETRLNEVAEQLGIKNSVEQSLEELRGQMGSVISKLGLMETRLKSVEKVTKSGGFVKAYLDRLPPDQRKVLEEIRSLPENSFAEAQRLFQSIEGQPMTEAFAKSFGHILRTKSWGVICEACDQPAAITWNSDSDYAEGGRGRFLHSGQPPHGSLTTIRILSFVHKVDKRKR